MTRRFVWVDGAYIDVTHATERVVAALRAARARALPKIDVRRPE